MPFPDLSKLYLFPLFSSYSLILFLIFAYLYLPLFSVSSKDIKLVNDMRISLLFKLMTYLYLFVRGLIVINLFIMSGDSIGLLSLHVSTNILDVSKYVYNYAFILVLKQISNLYILFIIVYYYCFKYSFRQLGI